MKTLTNDYGYHTVTERGHDVTLVRNKHSQDLTYTEIRTFENGGGRSTHRSDIFKVEIRLNHYEYQTHAKLFVWRDGWQEFHTQLITDLPANELSLYKHIDDLDISKFEASCEHLWLMACKYFRYTGITV